MARWRLACLWLSQIARVGGDNAMRLFVVLQLTQADAGTREEAWHLVSALLTLPAILFAPCYGALSNSLPKPAVLIGTTLCGVLSVALAVCGLISWMVAWALIAVGIAVYGPTRYALLPAAAHDARISLPRLNGIFETGAAVAIIAGVLLAARWASADQLPMTLLALQAAAFVFVLPVRFPSDVRRPEAVLPALGGFFRDTAKILRRGEVRACLLGLASLRALITAFMGALVADTLSAEDAPMIHLVELGLWVGAGVACGSFLVSLQKHPRRVLAFVPAGATIFCGGLVVLALGYLPGPQLCLLLGTSVGLINVPLSATYQADLPADARGNGMAARNFADYLAATVLVVIFYALAHWANWSAAAQFWLLAGIALPLMLLSWWWFLRPVFEQLVEWIVTPMYRIRARGPGLDAFPREGPLIIFANHSSWLDPVWLGKVLPRSFIPMMTSVFYDLPVLRWLMVHVAHSIRVEASTFRREVPELDQAVAALDRGEALIVFPEGSMRRRLEQPLKQFGQGLWRILKQRPQTPVMACWIEGGWGSFFSYFMGPPTKNKRLDWRRRIEIGVAGAFVVDADVLADQRSTRTLLMEACLQARQHLELEPLSLGAVPALAKEE